jgi:hypothetical protein
VLNKGNYTEIMEVLILRSLYGQSFGNTNNIAFKALPDFLKVVEVTQKLFDTEVLIIPSYILIII